jgi:hypothetical protein
VQVTSRPGHGSTFSVRLPLAEPSPAAAPVRRRGAVPGMAAAYGLEPRPAPIRR